LYPILLSAYNAPVVEKAQQAPQFPWFLTEVTAPLDDQSIYPTLT
jgi:hypothetical protein